MAHSSAALHTANLPERQDRLDLKTTPSLWRQSVEGAQLFATIPGDHLAGIISAGRTTTFGRGQTIYFAGEKIQRVMLLTEGSVKIAQLDEDGNTVILRLVGPGEVIGEFGGARQIVHSSAAQARTSCKALVWSPEVFDSLTQRFPRLWNNTTRILVERLQNLETRFCEMSNKTVAQRLALELARILPQVGKKADEDVEIDLSREELAQMIGTTLFSVSWRLSLWEEQGFVSLRRLGVRIRDPFSLMKISELE